MKKIENVKFLESFIIQYKINELFTKDMTEYMSLYMWNKNEYICKEGGELNNIFFLVRGKAKVSKNLANGKSLLISFYKPFRIIGDIEFARDNIADCSVQAIKDTYAIGIHFDVARSKLSQDPKFLLFICKYLSEKLSDSSNNNSITILYSLESRLASYIYAFVNEENNEEFTFEESYSEIAELLGTSYRHLNRTLNKLCADNILQKDGKKYIIKDIERLKLLSGDLYR